MTDTWGCTGRGGEKSWMTWWWSGISDFIFPSVGSVREKTFPMPQDESLLDASNSNLDRSKMKPSQNRIHKAVVKVLTCTGCPKKMWFKPIFEF